jgi:hypothetical protein
MSAEPFTIERVIETQDRTRLFREAGAALLNDIAGGKLMSPSTAVARLLEKAFTAGIEFGTLTMPAASPTPAPSSREEQKPILLEEGNLPPVVAECLLQLKYGLGWDRETGQCDPVAEGLVLIALPDDPEYPKKLRGRWFNSVSYGRRWISDRAVDRMVRIGLFRKPMTMEDGGMVTQMTEWGYELFKTAATLAASNRIPGASKTFDEYCDLTEREWSRLYMMVAESNGFVGEYIFRKASTSLPVARF